VGGLTPHYVLRDALVKASRRAVMAERELAWHRRLPDASECRAERDRAVHRCERLLAYAVARGVVSERGARQLAGCVYDALACERRWIYGHAHREDPDGHWPRMEVLANGIATEWARDRWRVAWSRRMFFH
jgi:hypothetical protein